MTATALAGSSERSGGAIVPLAQILERIEVKPVSMLTSMIFRPSYGPLVAIGWVPLSKSGNCHQDLAVHIG